MDLPVWVTLLILSAVVALSLALGHWLARRWRMDDYGMSISLVIGSMALAAAIHSGERNSSCIAGHATCALREAAPR